MTSRTSLLAAVAALAAVLGYAAVADSYAVFLIATISLTAIACIGLNVLLGLAGQISLGHIGFMAIGAYTTVLLMEKAGWPYLAATGAGIVLVSIIGGLLAMPALRVRGPYLAMVTIAFGFIVEHGTVEWRDLTGGGNGLVLTVPPNIFGMPLSERGLAIASVILVFAGVILFDRLKRSGWGYAMRAARDSEVATRSIGIDLVRVRTMAFVISAAAMALAGALFAPLQGYISPSSFPFLQSILLLFGVMIGGAGSALGPVIGAAAGTAVGSGGISLARVWASAVRRVAGRAHWRRRLDRATCRKILFYIIVAIQYGTGIRHRRTGCRASSGRR